MGKVVSVIFLALIGLGIYIINQNLKDIEETGKQNSSPLDLIKPKEELLDKVPVSEETKKQILENIEKTSEKIKREYKDNIEGDDDTSEIKPHEIKKYTEEEIDDLEDYEKDEFGDIDEEYREEVSDEDFSEFIEAAKEEILDDPEIASAIISEMKKIYKVQPDHQIKILKFYEDCSSNSKLPSHIKNLCDKTLRDIK
ncbi:MAG: hypothetical protein CME61_06040 [Halobacteriovoraceae bacterium]|nr:hypothetical protein [Halobacteriovoraceae bacterium]|tara:strand:- start:150 stop:743 length:594 start_codon:yes stop_codon:yes gene_type:complete